MPTCYYLPVTAHDATGIFPVALWAAAHLMLHIPNAMCLETVRAYYNGWYNDVVTERIPINAGMLTLPRSPACRPARRGSKLAGSRSENSLAASVLDPQALN